MSQVPVSRPGWWYNMVEPGIVRLPRTATKVQPKRRRYGNMRVHTGTGRSVSVRIRANVSRVGKMCLKPKRIRETVIRDPPGG